MPAITPNMQFYTVPLTSCTLEYDNSCHGLKLTDSGKTYVYMPQNITFNEASFSKTVAEYFVWKATQTCPQQLSATANRGLATDYKHYTGFDFAIIKIEPYAPKNEEEGYECLLHSGLFELVRVTFAYEWRTTDRTHTKTEELKFHRLL